MRLKSIKLAGFKSFVDATPIHFPSHITAIVGPNGCGKSNIIDAIRWVMGEGSAKHLRGESMADVIFNGSLQRSPLGQASVELHFENILGKLGGEYASYEEISIRRQVTRDGQSNYYLNGSRCRRKDITHIFLGTGLGPRSYAVIEQGTISKLIEAKPEELRTFIEEAAGISRYKERRKETSQRMEHTRENLLRINDVREELLKQITHLERQAKTAEKYREYKIEERQRRGQLLALKHKAYQRQWEETQQVLHTLGTQIAEQEQAQFDCNQDLQEQFDAQREAQNQLEHTQHAHAELSAAVRLCEQNIFHTKQQETQLSDELKNTLQQYTEALHLSTLDESVLAKILQELSATQEDLQAHLSTHEDRQKNHQTLAERQHAWQHQWQELNLHVATHTQTAQVEQTRMQQFEQRLQQIKQQEQKYQDEKNALVLREEASKTTLLEKTLHDLSQAREDAYTQLRAQEEKLKKDKGLQQALTQELNQTRSALQQLEGKLAALHTLQQQALGMDEKNTQAWLSEHAMADLPRLAEILEVAPGYESYLEHYLGEQLQAIQLTDTSTLESLLDDLPQGHLDFVHAQKTILPSPEAHPTLLAHKVSGPDALKQRLAHVYCARGLQEAFTMLPSLPSNAEIITPEGVVLRQGWIHVRRGKEEQSGVLQRKREIQSLNEEAQSIKGSLGTLEARYHALEVHLQEGDHLRQKNQKNWQALDIEWNQAQAQLQIEQSHLKQAQEHRQKLILELESLAKEHQEIHEKHTASRLLWQEALNTLNTYHQQRDLLSAEKETLEKELAEATQHLREAQMNHQELQLKAQRLKSEQEGLISQSQRTFLQLKQLEVRQNTLEQQLEALQPKLATLNEELLKLQEQEKETELQLEKAKLKSQEEEQQLRALDAQRQTITDNLEQLRQGFAQHQIQAEHLHTKSAHLDEQLQEMELTLEEASAFDTENMDETTLETMLELVQQRIERLGAINLAAISELEALAERKAFIDKQYDDLTEALNNLQQAIHEIDQETKEKFSETFDTVNRNFQALFPKIFGGGKAYLSYTSDDLLETGVTLFAQPPGKRNSSIHLLSGGEKALTALALVFGIFELNPAPFCILDEVDAPLDDANVGRFCNLVKAMAVKTQFIMVTHNKVAMEMADLLMGVTMQEPGVSRIVTVDVEAALVLAASDKVAA